MIRNAQLRFNENQSFEGKDLTSVGSIALDPNNVTVYPGQVKRGSSGELFYVHPTEGIIVLVDANGNVGNILNNDKFMQVTVSSFTTTTITHAFGRPAQVRVFEDNVESECAISYPPGEENSKVTVESNVPITATIFLS